MRKTKLIQFEVVIVKFTSTNQGKDILVDGGYLCICKQSLAGNKHSWECRFCRKTFTKHITLLNDAIVAIVNEHTHAPNTAEMAVSYQTPSWYKKERANDTRHYTANMDS